MIINLLVQEADAEKICEEIKQCVASISDIMSPYDTLPIVQPVSNDKGKLYSFLFINFFKPNYSTLTSIYQITVPQVLQI
jgi:hypothetical protein